MLRPFFRTAVLFAIAAPLAVFLLSTSATAQPAAPPRFGPEPSRANAAVRPNTFEPNKPVAMTNKIIKPVPLSADAQTTALSNIDRHISNQVADLRDKLKTILPDELAVLTKTTGWKAEDQQALVSALRAGDPTAVYETWVKGNPQDTAGAEQAARQTDVKHLMTQLVQDAGKNKAALRKTSRLSTPRSVRSPGPRRRSPTCRPRSLRSKIGWQRVRSSKTPSRPRAPRPSFRRAAT